MNFFRRLFMLVFMVMMIGVGVGIIMISSNILSSEQCSDMVARVGSSLGSQITGGVIGGLFVLIGIVAPAKQAKSLKKKRVIAFQNPDGEVTVSLSAIEEYIHKIAKGIPGIKDVRSHVGISKRGIDITIAVSLASGSNIPQITETIQMEVRGKVQSMLGVEEKINIKMHIKKIMRAGQIGEAGAPETDEEPHIPFREME